MQDFNTYGAVYCCPTGKSCTGATMEENMDYKDMCLDIINRMDDTQFLRKVYYLLVGMCGSN